MLLLSFQRKNKHENTEKTTTKSCGIYELTRDGQWFHGSAHVQTVTRDKAIKSELTGHLIFEYETVPHPMSYLLYLKPT